MRDRCVGAPTAVSHPGPRRFNRRARGWGKIPLAARWTRRLGGAQALPMRNGPYRWKAFPIEQTVAGHAAAVEAVSAALAREDPREGVKDGPKKTGAGEATGASEVGPMGRAGG